MISVAICIIFLLIFLAVPLPAQIILACINFLVPDPIPYIDEIIMVLSVMKKTVSAYEFCEDHPGIALGIAIGILALFILVLYMIFS